MKKKPHKIIITHDGDEVYEKIYDSLKEAIVNHKKIKILIKEINYMTFKKFLKNSLDFKHEENNLSRFEGLRVLNSHYDSYLKDGDSKQGISFDYECYYQVTEGNMDRVDYNLENLTITNVSYFEDNEGKRLNEKEMDILYKMVEYKLNYIL